MFCSLLSATVRYNSSFSHFCHYHHITFLFYFIFCRKWRYKNQCILLLFLFITGNYKISDERF